MNLQLEKFTSDLLSFELLTVDHAQELLDTCSMDTFKYYVSLVPASMSLPDFAEFIQKTLDIKNCVSVIARCKTTSKIVGKSSFMDIREEAKGLEIGMTWIAPEFQGTWVNPEFKRMMLKYAFEEWGAIRVQLKTDRRNRHSQRAIMKLGAQFEGVLRRHGIQVDGTVRDTVMFSILDSEWPRVESRLLKRLAAY